MRENAHIIKKENKKAKAIKLNRKKLSEDVRVQKSVHSERDRGRKRPV